MVEHQELNKCKGCFTLPLDASSYHQYARSLVPEIMVASSRTSEFMLSSVHAAEVLNVYSRGRSLP